MADLFGDIPVTRGRSSAPTAVQGRQLQNAQAGASIVNSQVNAAQGSQSLREARITEPARIVKTQADALKAQIELEGLQRQRGYLTPTEQQSLAAARAILMIEGEKTYKRGLQRGYKPNAFGNKVTAMLDKVPLFGKEAATLLRSPEAEMAVQGESTYRQGSLRSLTGSAGPEKEKGDVQEIAFPSPFQSGDRELTRRIAETRARQIAGMRAAAGPMLGEVYQDKPAQPAAAKPSLAQFLVAAKKSNPGVSDAALTAYYNKEYGGR